MLVMNTLKMPPIPVGSLRLHPIPVGTLLKPLGIGVGPSRNPLAGVRKDLGQAVRSALASVRVSIPAHARSSLIR